MIAYLRQRLNAEQSAIATIEEIIQHERDNRKEMSQDIKQRNKVLKTLIDKESNLDDRINAALEATLEGAFRDKMKMRKDVNAAKEKLESKNGKLDELRKRNATLKKQSGMQEEQIGNCNHRVETLTKQIEELRIQKDDLEHEN